MLYSIGEFGLIDLIDKQLQLHPSVIRGIGDDTAILPLSKTHYQLFTTDMMTEGVHFTKKMPAKGIGHKALACNISDIAAMGGIPTYAVVSLGVPGSLDRIFVQEVYKGMQALAK